MAKVDDETAKLVLLELAEWSGEAAENFDDLLGIAMDGRLYVEDDKVVYVLLKPLELQNGTKVDAIRMREPMVPDYEEYSKGMQLRISNGETVVDPGMLMTWTKRVVTTLGNVPLGVVNRVEGGMTKKDGVALMAICKALNFFD